MSSSPDESTYDMCTDLDEEDGGLSIARNHENMGQKDNIDDRRTSSHFTHGAENTSAEFITTKNDVFQQLKTENDHLLQRLREQEKTIKRKEQEIIAKERNHARHKEKHKQDKESFEESQKQLASQHEKEKEGLLKEIESLSSYSDQCQAQQNRIHELEKQQEQSNNVQTELKCKLQQAEGMILALRKDNNSLEEEKKRLLHRDKESFEESQKQLASQHEKEKEGLLREIERLSSYSNQCQAQQNRIHELEKQQEQSNNVQTELKCKLQQAEGMILALRKDNNSLEEEKKRLLHRLSQLAGAKLTLDNPNIADLSDTKRPTKLAEEFAELYDNEWTDAFEDVEIENEQAKTTFMLKVLQRVSEICSEVSNAHMDGIKKGLCTLTVRTNDSSRSASKVQPEQKIITMDNKDKENDEIIKAKRSRRNSQQEHTESHGPSMVVQTELTQMKVHEVTCDLNILRHDQKKTIMELRKCVEVNLSEQLEAVVTEVIAKENDFDKEAPVAVFKYIAKCVNICWSMCRVEPPVFISFPEGQCLDLSLDTNIYKPYTKTGKFIDYIVWPAVYLHKNGPLLCKGVAQGRT